MLVPKQKNRNSKKNLEELKRECRLKIWVPLVFIFTPLIYLALGLDLDKALEPIRTFGLLGVLIFTCLVVLTYGLCLKNLFAGLLIAREIDEISGLKSKTAGSSTLAVLFIIAAFVFIGWKTGLLRLLFNTF